MASPLTARDRLGGYGVRWGIGRMRYTVDPGLYALGQPGAGSPVLVSANYKLSFDSLRAACPGLAAWILVLDTAGVNVWCAAGKGTMGTANLVGALNDRGLRQVVSHRQLILPQLAAPGVSAPQVRRLSGFEVVFGPVMARDLPAFLAAGQEATPAMRHKNFPLAERLALAPVELVIALKYACPAMLLLFLLGGLGHAGGWAAGVWSKGWPTALNLLWAVLAGAVLGPALLPWLPGRAFAAKGLWLGLLAGGLAWLIGRPAPLEGAAWTLMGLGVVSFLVMNFTGASTYTSLSGVKQEMRWAVPVQMACAALGLVSWLASGLWA
ncbi:MAG: acetyl-CoA synthase subunit gamma [Desulfarculus sp.]|nr:acetyl-CoA synthase subunit gamma [Desulfarculus sp.]